MPNRGIWHNFAVVGDEKKSQRTLSHGKFTSPTSENAVLEMSASYELELKTFPASFIQFTTWQDRELIVNLESSHLLCKR